MTFEELQDLINNSSDGDVIYLSEERIRIKDDTPLTFPDNLKLDIIGAGKSQTVFYADTMTSWKCLFDLGSSKVRISQCGFDMYSDENGIIAYGVGWVIDNCRFWNTGKAKSVIGVLTRSNGEHPKGLIYNCDFINARVNIYGGSIMANDRWFEPSMIGTDNCVTIEDNIFDFNIFGNCLDSNYGGRYTFRYNTVNDSYVMSHAVQDNENPNRASRSWEIYNNTFEQKNVDVFSPVFMRGGTGVIYNNTVKGNYTTSSIVFDVERAFRGDNCPGGYCDGNSTWDGNIINNGSPCRDQIGTGKDVWLWIDDNNIPPQENEPAYIWNNTNDNGDNVEVYIHNNCNAWLLEGVNYILEARPDYEPSIYPHILKEKGVYKMGLITDAARIADGAKLPKWKTNTLGLIQQLDANLTILNEVKAKYTDASDLEEIDEVITECKSALLTMWQKFNN